MGARCRRMELLTPWRKQMVNSGKISRSNKEMSNNLRSLTSKVARRLPCTKAAAEPAGRDTCVIAQARLILIIFLLILIIIILLILLILLTHPPNHYPHPHNPNSERLFSRKWKCRSLPLHCTALHCTALHCTALYDYNPKFIQQ